MTRSYTAEVLEASALGDVVRAAMELAELQLTGPRINNLRAALARLGETK